MKSLKKNKNINIKQLAILEMVAQNPFMKTKELADKVGINVQTVNKWSNTSYFIDAFYDRFMEIWGKEIPKVLVAQIREAQAGNTQAATLVLKMWDKFQDTITLKVEAPRDTFRKSLTATEDIEEAEIVPEKAVEIGNSFDIPEDMLPPRNPENDNPRSVKRKQTARLKKVYKKDKINSQQMERHFWRKRAKAVNIDMLPPGRPSQEKLRKWQNSIVEAERVFANGIVSNKQKSPK